MVKRKTPARGERLRVAVLMGGPSSEHEVSLAGGAQVVRALGGLLYDVRPVVIAREGAWRLAPRGWGRGREGAATRAAFDPHELDGWKECRGPWDALEALKRWGVDVVLPVLHGRFGEDGTLQACLEAAGIPFVGSGMRGSAVAFDKVRAKEVCAFHGIPTPRFEALEVRALARRRAEWFQTWAGRFGLPFVLKNPCGGSTLEVHLVRDEGTGAAAIDALVQGGADRLLVEAYVPGRELTVGVIEERERGEPRALPVIEIRPRRGAWFDYQEKYSADGAEEICPAPLPDALAERVQGLALAVHARLGLRGLSRSDFILDADLTPWFLEVNTLPGMTDRGLVPLAARRVGIDFPSLLSGLIRTARL